MRSAVLLVGLLLVACNPVFAPPVRSTFGGAPARLSGREMEAAIEGNSYETGGPSVGYAINDHVVVEAGIDSAPSWLMSFGGLRLQARSAREDVLWAGGDVEMGAGIGVGGACDDDAQCEKTPGSPAAYGGYGGFGLAVGLDWFATVGRFRMQITDGDGLPTTTWLTGLVGFQFEIGRHVALHFGAGYASYSNAVSDASGILLDAGFAFRWDTGGQG